MAQRLSRSAPYQITDINIHSINDVFRQLQAAVDETKGLLGNITLYSAITFNSAQFGSTTDLKDVAATEDLGTSAKLVRADHRHAHGTGYLPDAHHAKSHQALHNNAGVDALKLDDLATPDDNTDLNASAALHGLLRKLSGSATDFLDGSGAWSTPSGSAEQKTPAFVEGAETTAHWEYTGDDHLHYALLVGRSGGQTLIGGTGTTDDLILRSTSGVGAAGADMVFQVGNNGSTEAMRILNSGAIGMGTAAPEFRLHLVGTVVEDNIARFENTSSTGYATFSVKTDTTAVNMGLGGSAVPSVPSKFYIHAGGTFRLVLEPTTGNFGFGTVSPGGRFHIYQGSSGGTVDASANALIVEDDAAGGMSILTPAGSDGNIYFGASTASSTLILRREATTEAFVITGDSGIERMRMTYGGMISIGTSALPTTGTKGLVFGDGTALATMGSNTAGLYANDIAGNVSMHAINENGDIIKLIKTGTYTPTNVTADRAYDANATSLDEIADVLGTLIADLQLTGLIV